ncbi:2-dehydropantoate 2-reductase [Glaciecola siphonariae]|uniref:2-dehydropantoate 2-reductase n=1 Tax=Glaciecola siphonariae TaxID=521012 RepID=A0ABV9LSM9_9ALTE
MSAKIAQVKANNHAHHLIFGTGLIGSYLGGALIRAQQRVSFVGRKHFISQISARFTLSDYSGNRCELDGQGQGFLLDELAKVEAVDILWLCVKCTALESAAADMRELVTKNTIIICCQNGVGTHHVIENAFPHNHVIRAMVPFNVVNDEPGVFHRGTEGSMILEVSPALNDSIKWLSRQMNTEMLPVDISYHMTDLQWAKLQLNLGNAVNALADIPVKAMLETREYRFFIARLMNELLKVTEKQKIKLPKIANLPNTWIPSVLKLPNLLFKLVAKKMLAIDPQAKTSMWWDLHNQRTTEIDFINGKVVSQAKKLDMTAPANEWMVSLIHQAQSSKRLTAKEFKAALLQFEQENNT